MKISVLVDDEFKAELEQAQLSLFSGKTRDKVHVSTLTSCKRKAYWDFKINAPPTTVDAENFWRGKTMETGVVELCQIIAKKKNAELKDQYNPDNVEPLASIDVFFGGAPYELKDSASGIRKRITSGTFRDYLKQLLFYMVKTGNKTGKLIIHYQTVEMQFMGERCGTCYQAKKNCKCQQFDADGSLWYKVPKNAKPSGFEVWKIGIDSDEMVEKIRYEMRFGVAQMNLALRYENPRDLPKVKDEQNWKCEKCKYKDICKDTPETDVSKEFKNAPDWLDEFIESDTDKRRLENLVDSLSKGLAIYKDIQGGTPNV